MRVSWQSVRISKEKRENRNGIGELRMSDTEKPNINNSCEFIVGQVYDCCADCWRYNECKECMESEK